MAKVIVALVAALAISGCFGESSKPESSPAPNGAQLLYVQTADSGRITSQGRKQVMTLGGVSRATTTFTDRPERRSGQMSTGVFAGAFNEIFGDDPPNADLSSLKLGKGEFTVQLSEPNYDPDQDTLTYTISPVGQDGAGLPTRIGPASLFIDAAGGRAWDTRLHLYNSSTGDICQSNGLDGQLSIRVKQASDIINAPATWIFEPTPGNEPTYFGQYYTIPTTTGILLGGQMAEGANKNGPTKIVIDWTLSCGEGQDIAKVRTAAAVPDSQLEANTARCVFLDKTVSIQCNSYIDSGFHTAAYFRFHN